MSASHHPNIQGLIELARRDGVDIPPMLLRVLVELCIQECVHTPSARSAKVGTGFASDRALTY
jgi:hypothetical protein